MLHELMKELGTEPNLELLEQHFPFLQKLQSSGLGGSGDFGLPQLLTKFVHPINQTLHSNH